MVKVRVYQSTVNGVVEAPSSKSYTHRAVIFAALSDGRSRINRPLLARDTIATIEAVKAIGAEVTMEDRSLAVKGVDRPQTPEDVIDVENSGTTIRLMTSVSALAPTGYTVLTGDSSLRQRPMQPLLDALTQLGVRCWSTRLNGKPPIVVQGGGIKGGVAAIRGDVSSQFISSLLIATPMAESDTTIQVVGSLVSKPYVEATLYTMREFGGKVADHRGGVFYIPRGQRYTPAEVNIPGDFSSAAFVLAAAALTGGEVEVSNLFLHQPQADSRIIEILRELGADVEVRRGGVKVRGSKGLLKGGVFNLSDCPDLLPIVIVLGLRCREWVEVIGVAHARYKETDRLSVLAEELSKMGATVLLYEDGLKIRGGTLKRATLDSKGDHRLFMAFCLAGLLVSGCEVTGAETVDVSYPTFIEDMKKIGAPLEVV